MKRKGLAYATFPQPPQPDPDRMIVEAGPLVGQSYAATDHDLVTLGIAPGSPEHYQLNAMLRIAYAKGQSAVHASYAVRLGGLFGGQP